MAKKLLLLALVATFGLGACHRTQCPAYSSTKAANRVSTTLLAADAFGFHRALVSTQPILFKASTVLVEAFFTD